MAFPSYLKVLLNWKDLYLLSQINVSGIASSVIIIVFLFKYMKKIPQTKMKEEQLEPVIPLTNKELEERKKTRAKIRKENKKKLMKNKEDYYNKESEIMKAYKDKYVAFSNGKVIGHAETSDGLSEFIGDDTTIFTIQVGKERTEPSMDEILLLGDFVSTSSTQDKTCFPYHGSEQKIIRFKEFKKSSGWWNK